MDLLSKNISFQFSANRLLFENITNCLTWKRWFIRLLLVKLVAISFGNLVIRQVFFSMNVKGICLTKHKVPQYLHFESPFPHVIFLNISVSRKKFHDIAFGFIIILDHNSTSYIESFQFIYHEISWLIGEYLRMLTKILTETLLQAGKDIAKVKFKKNNWYLSAYRKVSIVFFSRTRKMYTVWHTRIIETIRSSIWKWRTRVRKKIKKKQPTEKNVTSPKALSGKTDEHKALHKKSLVLQMWN